MKNQNLTVALVLLTSVLCVAGQTNELEAFKKPYLDILGQVARDAITITLGEVNYAKDFMVSIPKLKSMGQLKGTRGDEVLQCVRGLADAMSNVLSVLKEMEHLDSGVSIRSLENMVRDVLSYKAICDRALGGVDATIKIMVLRKLEDIVILTNDVVFRFGNLQLHGKAPVLNP